MQTVTYRPEEPWSLLSSSTLIIRCQPEPMPDFECTLDDFLEEVQKSFEQQLKIESLLSLSKQLQTELKQHLISSPQCMLPSFNYTLPTGEEQGTYLALEVGGSNLRMALVELRGRSQEQESMHIQHTLSFCIDNAVRQLQDHAFFDWMAEKIGKMLVLQDGEPHRNDESEPLRMGVAWSFPIESVLRCYSEESVLTSL